MRKKFDPQYSIGQKRIEDTKVNLKCRDDLPKLIMALKELFIQPKYNQQLFSILEDKISKDKKRTGRWGMDLWQIFVFAEVRLCLNADYDRLHDYANNHATFRQILGVETDFGFEKYEFEYQNIVDNINLLDDITLIKINDLIVEMGHDVFKKKETEALQLKTDSFVVESNVHFPTDYNLLWDSARKCIDTLNYFLQQHSDLPGWRNLSYWYRTLKNKMREISQSKNKPEEKRKEMVSDYIDKALLFSQKISKEEKNFPMDNPMDMLIQIELEYYKQMLDKHIDLLERRVLKAEIIPHGEKMFSIFETYTEWLTKGKQNPSMELGKNVQVTTDQYHLIIDFEIMEHQVDKQCVLSLYDRVSKKYQVEAWSFDKGYYSKENKELLSMFINNLTMPKKGKLNKNEKEEENTKTFRQFRNRHSAVESNINELEHNGLDRCPDRGYEHFKRYIALGICSYNLHKIGNELFKQEKIKLAA